VFEKEELEKVKLKTRHTIDAKMKGKTFVSTAPKQKGSTKDLLQALKASIETKKK
jgi:non-homologous end joining protein Ku